ncbi:MAG: protein kinase [Planctomycetaceae bacterium]|nr:protein kinase [Planctomycetaceae bacterium]
MGEPTQDAESWARARELFLDLVELEPAARAASLQALRADDANLAAWVERLLERDDGAEHKPISRRFGPYETTARIASGGMGDVYLARRVDGEFERQVAIKLLRCNFRGDEVLRRFQRERQVLAGLDHEFVARLLDGGTTPDGEPYLVMEYVDGLPLDRHVSERGLDLADRLELFQRVLAAVAHAHERGVIHRDLKPSNILVRSDGSPRLLDFGISRPKKDTTPGGPLTRTGHRLFTPEYASPEQVRGEEVTPASDAFALGVILYELLCDERPFGNSDSLHDLEQAILQTQPLPPSRRKRGTARRALAGDLDTIAMKCLAKAPSERYPDAAALAKDVERHLLGFAIEARPVSMFLSAWRAVRRRPGIAVAVGAVLCAIAVSLLAWRAESTRVQQEAELVRSLGARIDGAAELRKRGQLPAARAELESVLAAARALPSERVLLARAEAALGVVANHESRWKDARAHFERAWDLLAALADAPAEAVASAGNGLAYSLFKGGFKEQSLAAAERALAHARATLPEGHELRTDALLEVSDQRSERGEHELSMAALDEALAGLRARGDPRDANLGAVANSYGSALFHQGRYEEALARFREAEAALAFHLGAGDPSLARIARSAADCLRQLGRFDEARAELLPAVERYRELDRDADLAESLRALGELDRDAGDLDAALVHLAEGRERFAAAFSASHPALSKFDQWLADVHERRGEPAKARALFERALAGPHSLSAYGPAAEGQARAGLGRVLLQLGDRDAGRSELERALVLLTRAHGEGSAEASAVRALLDQ